MNKRNKGHGVLTSEEGFQQIALNGMPPEAERIIQTKSGYALQEVTSAIIKDLRRGHEEEALFWAQEMESVAPNYLWKRLLIFATEDIGLADPDAIVRVQALAWAYQFIKSIQKSPFVEGDVLAQAILILARAPKDTEVDDFKNAVHARKAEAWRPPIPDYALDGHTLRGRAMGRGEKYWYDARQEVPGWKPNKYTARARAGSLKKEGVEE